MATAMERGCSGAISLGQAEEGHFGLEPDGLQRLEVNPVTVIVGHPRILLHTSRAVRWDSDHVVVLDDAVRALFLEIARGDAWDRVFVALDFFDASINRIAAYVIGARATRQAILLGMLDPSVRLRAAEDAGRGQQRPGPHGACKGPSLGSRVGRALRAGRRARGADWLREVTRYERRVLSRRR